MATGPNLSCDDEQRRASIATAPLLHGIDYLEVVTAPAASNQRVLEVHFVPKRTPAGAPDPVGTADLAAMLAALHDNTHAVRIDGGTRETNIVVTGVTHVAAPNGGLLRVSVDRPGDFSEYTLRLVHPRLDPRRAGIRFGFKAGCPSRFDCRLDTPCPVDPVREPAIDYLAKDYASFRQALLDFLPTLIPQWQERHEADLGMALIELFAYVGDHLSYYQDAVANEAHLETARSRISLRRHVRLLDYRMHDGASARAFVHLAVAAAGTVPEKTQLLSRVTRPVGPLVPPLPAAIPPLHAANAVAAADAVFETLHELHVDPRLDAIAIHTWGDNECCLPRGTTGVELVGDLAIALEPGAFLLLEETVGPESGLAADAEPTHRQVVRLVNVRSAHDPLPGPGGTPLTRVDWDVADALRFPLCLSARLPSGVVRRDVGVARGNVVLADHGRTLHEWHPADPADPTVRGLRPGPRGLRLRLREGPLAFGYPWPDERDGVAPAARFALEQPQELERLVDPCRIAHAWMLPRVDALVGTRTGTPSSWTPRDDLLTSRPFDLAFVVETEHDGRAVLRFGDGVFGAAVPDGAFVRASYRVGIGAAGNVGADAIVHVVDGSGALPPITSVRNPLPAFGGTDQQPAEEVKRLAPAAIGAVQYRAVTEDDYARAAEQHPAVAKAAATFRWTGSWHTVFVIVDPKGGYTLDDATAQDVRTWVECYTQTGYDVEIDPPRYVPLDVAISVCVAPGYFRGDVERALLARLSSRTFADGSRGFFHPDAFSFGDPVHLSHLYAAIDAVQGVESAQVTRLQRLGQPASTELDDGVLSVGRLEVIRLDNDPSFPENGQLALAMLGGT